MRKFYPVNQLPEVLVLGAQTEHGVTELCFDCSVWLDIWPELELSIWVTPPSGDQYPAGAHMDGKILVWPVSAADTACVGKGRMEIMGVSEGKKKLSAIADTLITATSTDTSPNPPPVHEAWVEKVALDALAAKNAAGEAEKFARAAEEAKETAIEAANAVGDVIGAKNEALDEISNQKENSVKAVQDQQAVSVKTVQDQQSASVMAVDQAKSASVKALQDESANQQNAVAAKGKETVDSIPADYTNLAGKVGQLSEEALALLKSCYTEEFTSYTWRQGHLSSYNGALQTDSTNRCVIVEYFHFDDAPAFMVSVKEGYQFVVHAYSSKSTANWLGMVAAYGDDPIMLLSKDDVYYKIAIKRDDDADFAPSDIPADCVTVLCCKSVNGAIDTVEGYLPGDDTYLPNSTWVQGGISYKNGNNLTADNRCRSTYLYYGDATIHVVPADGYKFNFYKFNILGEPSTFVEAFEKFIANDAFLNCDHKYLRFTVAKTDDSVLEPEDVPADAIKISIVGNTENYPAYYVNHIAEKVERIIDNMGQVGADGESFVFITDLHWDTGNAKKSPRLVKEIVEKTNLNTVICGGDLINEGEKDVEQQRILDCIKAFQIPGVPFPVAFGNHDDNSNNQSDSPDEWFSRNELFSLIMKPASNYVSYLTNVDWSFTYDRTGTKTRFLFIDTGTKGTINENARQSIYNALKDIPDGHNVIIVAHWLYSVTDSAFAPYGEELVGVLDAYNAKKAVTVNDVLYDYAGASGEVKCILIGHSHADAQGVTPGGIPWMLTDCDSYRRSNSAERIVNTLTEQCFDVVSVNYATGDINAVRIGAGADRSYSGGAWK